MSDLRLSALPRFSSLRRGTAIALLLFALLGVGACSSPDPEANSEASAPAEDVEAAGDDSDPQAKRVEQANGTLSRFIVISGKVYSSAYRNNWQKAASQFNRLQDMGDRLDDLVASGAIDDVDIEALLLQIDTLEEAIVSEQQIPAMVVANELVKTGLDASEAIAPEAASLSTAQLAYYGRELELVSLGPDGDASPGLDPEKAETLKQAADQVIQTWDSLDAATLGTAASGDAAEAGKEDSATRVGNAVNQLRQATGESYAPLARQVVVGSQKMLMERSR